MSVVSRSDSSVQKFTPLMNIETQPTPVIFTDAAATKIYELLQDEENSDMMLRVFIVGGGCSGFSYGFKFEEELEDGDVSVENKGVTLIVDPMSIQYLMGAEVDYEVTLQAAQFVIRNPNAKSTCGCNQSFSV